MWAERWWTFFIFALITLIVQRQLSVRIVETVKKKPKKMGKIICINRLLHLEFQSYLTKYPKSTPILPTTSMIPTEIKRSGSSTNLGPSFKRKIFEISQTFSSYAYTQTDEATNRIHLQTDRWRCGVFRFFRYSGCLRTL